jgi:hypothetical protein
MTDPTLRENLNDLFSSSNDFKDFDDLTVTFAKNMGASQQDIKLRLLDLGVKIPTDYVDFLKSFDGCTLFNYNDIGGFEFLGTNEILNETNIQSKTYEDDWDNGLTVFCRLIGEGDFICFRDKADNGYDILDCDHDDSPKNWNVIDHSFNNFLKRLIEEKGRRYWL